MDISSSLDIELTPLGHLRCFQAQHDFKEWSGDIQRIQGYFEDGYASGLLRLGLYPWTGLPPGLAFWQRFARLFVMEVCKAYDAVTGVWPEVVLQKESLQSWMAEAPFMRGMEYLSAEVALKLWGDLNHVLKEELRAFKKPLAVYLADFDNAWNAVGRICFHLVENKGHSNRPFAFLATYTTGLTADRDTQHLPLSQALEEYAEQKQKSQLLNLLQPVQRASEKSIFLNDLVREGSIFKPQAWSAREAFQFLRDIPIFEEAGLMVRVPNWWQAQKPPRPMVQVSVGDDSHHAMGLKSLLDFNLAYALPSGELLTDEEWQELMHQNDPLVRIRNEWVHVDPEQLQEVLEHWQQLHQRVQKEGLSFAEGLRLLAGFSPVQTHSVPDEILSDWTQVVEGEWLQKRLKELREPKKKGTARMQALLQEHLHATLRPYQEQGVSWLWWLYRMRLGGCLADDMGLGKTIQVIAFLILVKHQSKTKKTHLLILPASLMGNWQAEIQRFAPGLSVYIAHRSAGREERNDEHCDLVITTYASVDRLGWIKEKKWDVIILDEAQAVKNPQAKQTRAIKKLKSHVRLILTGTPIENRLFDLWSLFDFIAPGLLGSSQAFVDYGRPKSKEEGTAHRGVFYAAIRRLVKPYILRRMKSDQAVLLNLPQKTEVDTYCPLTKEQIKWYQLAIDNLSRQLRDPQFEPIKRRGLILSCLIRLKQICNHPAQCLGHGEYAVAQSGKFLRLKELVELVAEKQEKMLIFTQFREIMPALYAVLREWFGAEGLMLHGQTPVKERSKKVELFQQEGGPPFFLLSLRAGGTGLNLTEASHVVHFDRWWNPAIENQATDRAYRIGQDKPVLVHKFICQGTIEEKIDALIRSKKTLAQDIIGAEEGDMALTELDDSELLNVVSLDIHRALGESESF